MLAAGQMVLFESGVLDQNRRVYRQQRHYTDWHYTVHVNITIRMLIFENAMRRPAGR
jgi:hypothetical protein